MDEEKKIPEEKGEEEKEKKKGWTIWFWFIVAIVFVSCFLVDFLLLKKYSIQIWKTEWNWGWAAFWTQIAYFLCSFRQVGPTETGVKLFFGKPIQKVESGLVFVPRWIFQLVTITKIVREKEYPDPEKIWRGEEPIPPGKIPPIRVIQGQKETENGKEEDPLDKRMTTEISIIGRYRIIDFMIFIGTIGSVEELDRTIEDVLIASLRKDLAIISPAETLIKWKKIEDDLQDEIKLLVEDWGVDYQTVRLKEVDVGHKVNSSLRDIIAAALNKKSTIINAEAKKQKDMLEGEGFAWAKKVILEARGAGLKRIATELDLKESELVLFADTVEALTEKSQYTLLTGAAGIADLFGVIGAIKNILPKIKAKEA